MQIFVCVWFHFILYPNFIKMNQFSLDAPDIRVIGLLYLWKSGTNADTTTFKYFYYFQNKYLFRKYFWLNLKQKNVLHISQHPFFLSYKRSNFFSHSQFFAALINGASATLYHNSCSIHLNCQICSLSATPSNGCRKVNDDQKNNVDTYDCTSLL